MMTDMPPGSPEALAYGCICPVLDNAHGRGVNGLYWHTLGCPVHHTRIQRKRVRGWRMPAGAISVTRPGRWGNPYTLADYGRDDALMRFEADVRAKLAVDPSYLEPLRGHLLACWCKHNEACHADIYITLLAETAKSRRCQ